MGSVSRHHDQVRLERVAQGRRAHRRLLGRQPQGNADRPDWNRHAKAAPFKRNDQMLNDLPIGVVVFPGSGISDNLADKAKALGIPVLGYRKRAVG